MNTPAIHLAKRQRYVLELLLVAVCILAATRHLQNFSPQMRIEGAEFSYLVNSGAVAARTFQHNGAIPLWNPLIGRGEPLVENPFSFVLNPLMTAPILAFGPIQGAKLATIGHILLMAFGGWVLGWMLDLRAPGRVLLALLLGGSGSLAGALSQGFYQMGLSQTYVPWVYAGLFGTLYKPDRRYPVVLLVIATTLLIFAGTFWYVLPTAIVCAGFVLFAVVRKRQDRWRVYLDSHMLRRLTWAGVLIIGLAAVRLLPQAVHHHLVDHQQDSIINRTVPFVDLMRLYITPEQMPHTQAHESAIYYHYIVPPFFSDLIVLLRLLMFRSPAIRATRATGGRWRVFIPALLCITFFTVWAMENTPLFVFLYSRIPFLFEWRFLGRMLAAATPLIALLLAVAFDDILRAGWDDVRNGVVRVVGGGFLLVLATIAAVDVLGNYNRITHLEPQVSLNAPPLRYLRTFYPDSMLPVLTHGFDDYLPFYETLSRATFGNPDYRPAPLPETVGHTENMAYLPPYAIAYHPVLQDILRGWEYRNINAIPDPNFAAVTWENPGFPSYAFTVYRVELLPCCGTWLSRTQTIPVDSYSHHFDSIQVRLDARPSLGDQLLVVHETAYPGWQVTINGAHAPIESVGGVIGVTLPGTGEAMVIDFHYRPYWLYVGAVITLITAAVIVLYLLLPVRSISPAPVFRRWRS